jgi:hypothetical protein
MTDTTIIVLTGAGEVLAGLPGHHTAGWQITLTLTPSGAEVHVTEVAPEHRVATVTIPNPYAQRLAEALFPSLAAVAPDETVTVHMLRRAAKRAYERRLLTAGALARAGVPLTDLPLLLACTPGVAWRVALCGAPGGDWPPERWAGLLATAFELDEGRLLDLAHRLVAEEEVHDEPGD